MHIIFESVVMLYTQDYQNKSMLEETTACQSCSFSETQRVYNPDY